MNKNLKGRLKKGPILRPDVDYAGDIELGTYIDARERYDYLQSADFLNSIGITKPDHYIHNHLVDKKD